MTPHPLDPAADHEAPEPAIDAHGNLTDRGRAILDFENQHWRYAGQKETLIRERFGVSATQYYQILGTLLRTRAAHEYSPVLVNLRRRQVAERWHENGAGGGQPPG